MKKPKPQWEIELDQVLEEDEYGYSHDHFGINVDFYDAKRYFRGLEKASAFNAQISIRDEYTAVITLPPTGFLSWGDTLMYILTTSPRPSECNYNKKKNTLTLEWDF